MRFPFTLFERESLGTLTEAECSRKSATAIDCNLLMDRISQAGFVVPNTREPGWFDSRYNWPDIAP